MSRWGHPPPAWLVRLSLVVVVVGVVLMVAGAVRTGVTVDETFHVIRLRNFLDHGWYLLDDDLAGGVPGDWVEDSFVYAPVATLLLHLPNVLLGNESWSEVSASADAFVVRHLGTVAIGLATLVATAVVTRVLSASWRWAGVSAAVLVCLPVWTGHSMFNVKDVPVAAGYTWVTLACVLLLCVRPEARWQRAGTAALLVAGLVVAVGTRPAIWPGLAASAGCVLLAVASGMLAEGRQWWRVRDACCAAVVAVAGLAAVYPAVFTRPVQVLLGSTSESAGYRGERFWAYIPIAVLCTVPVVLLLFGLVGSLVRLRHRLRGPRSLDVHDVMVAVVVLQATLLPVLLIIRMPALNGGLRHLLFAAPAVAVLVAAGIAQVLADCSGRAARRAVAAVAAVGLAVPLVTQLQLFPYGYAYANPVSDALGAEFVPDFWQASLREHADDLPPGSFVVCGARGTLEGRIPRQIPNGGQSWLEVSQDCADPGRVTVLAPYVDGSRTPAAVADTFVALLVYDDPATGCEELGRVTRRRLLTDVVVSRAVLCPLVLPAYDGPVALDGAGRGAAHLLGGWTGTGGDAFVSVTDRASVGFAVEGGRQDLVVTVSGEADDDVSFLLNDVPATATPTAGGWEVVGRGDLPAVGGRANVVLTVVPSGTARISRVELERIS